MRTTSANSPLRKTFGAKQATGILLAFIFTMVFANYLSSLIVVPLFALENPVDGQEIADTNAGAILVLQQLAGVVAAALVTIYLLRFYFPGSIKEGALVDIGVVKCSLRWGISAILFGFFFFLIFARVLGKMFPPNEDFVPNPLMSTTQTGDWVQFLTVFMVVGIAPVVEELLFRGILYRGFSESWGKLPAWFSIFVLFILVHNETLSGGYWLSVAALVLISGFLLMAREISGSLIPPMLMHLGFNFAVILPT